MKPTAPPPRLFEALEAPLRALDPLPRGLWLWTLVHSHGRWLDRPAALETWRQALIAGTVPSQPGWPSSGLAHAITDVLQHLGLPAFCHGKAELAEQVLRALLWHLDQIPDYRDRGASLERAQAMALEAFADDWRERTALVDALTEVLGDLGELKNMRWDVVRGLLRSEGWQTALRIRRLIEDLPGLSALIAGLGRDRDCTAQAEESSTGNQAPQPLPVPRMAQRRLRVPDLPGETRGVQRADRIARMLPAEAMLLGHPRLRLVWHARRAERTLLCYEDDDCLLEPLPRAQPATLPQPRPRREMGPMMICVDTSASMRGGAEAVAKAVVLEAARIAHAQRRACHVYAFGGPDEVVELTLGFDSAGLTRLVDFIGQAFRGGTDICLPLERALARLGASGWQQADLMIASDGEFGATPALAAAVLQAKTTQGLRVQGVLIGDRETVGLAELADDVFWVRDWRRFGGSSAASPVHDRRLTALYFPGALRSAQNRAATLDGEAAARAVRAGRKESNPT